MINWRNWKTGAKIGLLYGLICALYFAPIIFNNFSPTPDYPIRMCDDTCTSTYKIIGFLLFFPLVILSLSLWISVYQTLPVYQIILMNSIIVMLLGTALGALVGHLFSDAKKTEK